MPNALALLAGQALASIEDSQFIEKILMHLRQREQVFNQLQLPKLLPEERASSVTHHDSYLANLFD